MKYSVLVPVYNVREYLSECLDSILNQNYEDMELIVVNDGSTDGSDSICREYRDRYPDKIVLIEQRNHGLLLARRAGIDVACGEYLIFVDSDDALRNDALRVIDENLNKGKADVLIFQASRNQKFDVPYFDHSDLYKVADADGLLPVQLVREQLAISHSVNSMWGKAIRRECVDQMADYTSYEGLQYGEDLLQMAPIFNVSSSIAISKDILYFYRDNGKSISHHVNPSRLDDIQIARSRLKAFVELWDSNLLPRVYSNDCVEVFSYCLMCANRLKRSEAAVEIDRAAALEYFRNSYRNADLAHCPAWKRIGIEILAKGYVGLFISLYHSMFQVLGLLKPGKAARYI